MMGSRQQWFFVVSAMQNGLPGWLKENVYKCKPVSQGAEIMELSGSPMQNNGNWREMSRMISWVAMILPCLKKEVLNDQSFLLFFCKSNSVI